jgi:hypothetical protein
MITVTIAVNAQVIYARTAVNVGELKDGVYEYEVDDGTTIEHFRDAGAIPLAHKMLDTIEEVK